MRTLLLRLCLTGLAVLAAGCGAGWHQVELTPGTLPSRQQVQIFSDGRMTQMHGVRATADSITGIRFIQSTSCDSCRVSFARASVDSVRVGSPVAGFWKTTGLILGSLLGVMILFTIPAP